VADVIHQTPPPISVSKIVTADPTTIRAETAGAETGGAEATRAETTVAEATGAEATGAETGTNEDPNLETTLEDIDNMLLRMAEEETAMVTVNTATEKGKEQIEDILEKEDFNFQDILGQELSDAKKEELKKYAISCGYKPGSLLFGGVNEGKLRCLRNRTEAKVVRTFSKSVGLSKIEADLCRYQRQHIASSLLYDNFKVKKISIFYYYIFFYFELSCFLTKVVWQSILLSKVLRMQQDLEDEKNEATIKDLEKNEATIKAALKEKDSVVQDLKTKVKDHEAALEKKDFVIHSMEGSLAEAQAENDRLNNELLKKSEKSEQEKKNLETSLKIEIEKNSNLQKSLKELQEKCLNFGS
jgi:hypothetical protein